MPADCSGDCLERWYASTVVEVEQVYPNLGAEEAVQLGLGADYGRVRLAILSNRRTASHW